MRHLSFALAALASLTCLPAYAKTIPSGCNPAVQNWVNGSGYACPLGGGSAVGAPQAPTPAAPPPIKVDCGAATIDILPPVLRKRTMTDFAGGSEAPSPCST